MEELFLEGLDALFAENRAEEAGKYLEEWYQKGINLNDWKLLVTVLNEMMGFYRSMGMQSEAMDSVEQMIKLVEQYSLYDNPDIGTVWINVGTTLCRFYQYEEGLKYYQKAKEALTGCENLYILASLYNNSAAALEASDKYNAAIDNYNKSLEYLSQLSDCATFEAITYANMANCYFKADREDMAQECIKKMDDILEAEDMTWDAGYASACVKCGSLHYNIGNINRADELTQRADQIYKGGIL